MPRVLQSKLRPAAIPRFAVGRGRVLELLDTGSRRRLTLVAAPAGYGKSVALAQWAETRAGTVAWLATDARDSDPTRCASHLLAALSGAHVECDDDARSLLAAGSGSLGDAFVDAVITALDEHGAPLNIVLEDIDRIESSPMLADFERLIAEAPPDVRFMVSCRADPSISVQRLRVRGELMEVRTEDLRFTAAEARALIDELSGRVLNDDQAAVLVARTEGWPVAVQLAAVSLGSAPDPAAFVADFAGDDRNVADFLSSELLQNEADDVRRFLLDISVLDEISADLCDAMLERIDSEHMLRVLEQRGLFLNSIDNHGHEYRYHRLVREFLRHDLQRDDPARARVLRRRAAGWFLDHDDPLHAADLLIDAEAWDALENTIWRHTRELWEAGMSETVLTWIEAFPPAHLRNNVRLQLGHAALRTISGQPTVARAILDELDRSDSLTAAQRLAADMIIGSHIETIEPPALIAERTERALATLAATPDIEIPEMFGAGSPASIECLLTVSCARAHLLLGDLRRAREIATGAVLLPGAQMPNWHVQAHGTLALINALRGDLNHAEGSAGRALDVAAQHLATSHPATLTPLLARAVVARARNNIDSAIALCQAVIERARRWRRWTWLGFGYTELGFSHLAAGRPDAALRAARDCAEMPAPPPGPFVAARLRALEALAFVMLGQHDVAQQLLEVDAPTPTVEVATARLLGASASGDTSAIRKALDAWPVDAFPFGALEFELWTAILAAREGDRHGALDLAADLAARAELDGYVRLFLDAGPDGLRLVRDLSRARPNRFVHSVVDAAAQRSNASTSDELVEQLSDRELSVLRHLPRRGTYSEIARELYVSPNTVKTHVRHICQKLGVSGRSAAVAKAERLGLL